jgi:hypothetical protein
MGGEFSTAGFRKLFVSQRMERIGKLSHEVGIQYSRDISRRWEMSCISKLGKITILCIDVGIQDKGVMYRGW